MVERNDRLVNHSARSSSLTSSNVEYIEPLAISHPIRSLCSLCGNPPPSIPSLTEQLIHAHTFHNVQAFHFCNRCKIPIQISYSPNSESRPKSKWTLCPNCTVDKSSSYTKGRAFLDSISDGKNEYCYTCGCSISQNASILQQLMHLHRYHHLQELSFCDNCNLPIPVIYIPPTVPQIWKMCLACIDLGDGL